MSSAAHPPQPNHRTAIPGRSILRVPTSTSELSRRARDDPERNGDPALSNTARSKTLGRPRTSREDYYGPKAGKSDPLPELSYPTGQSLPNDNVLAAERDVVVGRRHGPVRDEHRPFVHQQPPGPVARSAIAGRPPPPPMKGTSMFSGSPQSKPRPQYFASGAVSVSTNRYLPVAIAKTARYLGKPLQRPRRRQSDYSQDAFKDILVTHWLVGSGYAPVLTPWTLPLVDARPVLNPLLCPPSVDDTSPSHRVKWNMIYLPSYARCSRDVSEEAWSDLLHSPATFPRLRKMFLTSKSFPWTIHVNAEDTKAGVTCGDVLDEIFSYLYDAVLDEELAELSPSEVDTFKAAYRTNRSQRDEHGEPASTLLEYSDEMRRVDWFARNTIFGGLEPDDAYVKERFDSAMPATFVLLSQDADAVPIDIIV
ncbi:hypothetical protein PLICRDRAFT_698433 [Plicaturopsis crispa FD-325 SS-3]|nr:hypothetical protein PLICRDRAFT_698433 [Plicaturopsis crispa FD-325 SS-3]